MAKTSLKDRKKTYLTRKMLSICVPDSAYPTTIPRSGKEGLAVDQYSIFATQGNSEYLLRDWVDQSNLHALKLGDQRNNENTVISVEELIQEYQFKIVHYCGLSSLEFSNVSSFLFSHYSGSAYGKLAIKKRWDDVSQFFFNKKSIALTTRYSVLKSLIENEDWASGVAFTTTEVLLTLNGYRVVRHPQFLRQSRRLKLILDSLTSTEELSKRNNPPGYLIKAKALVTLEATELSERRHREMFRMQVIMMAATVVIALSSVLSAVF